MSTSLCCKSWSPLSLSPNKSNLIHSGESQSKLNQSLLAKSESRQKALIYLPIPKITCESAGNKESAQIMSFISSPLLSFQLMSRRRVKSVSGSQSSLASTPGQSTTTTATSPKQSDEWPDPPVTDPPVCSTEDEAASIYSDSGELLIELQR